MDSADVNAWLAEAAGERVTAKDFRTWHGSVLALQLALQSCADGEPPCRPAQVVAQVAQLKRTSSGLRLAKVICAVDCGLAVNPDIVRAQMEGGIGYGLAAALTGEITLKDGIVEQSNFDDYPVLRINQMPAIDVHIVPSTAKPTGVGEPGTPPIAPALANALALANGQPVRTLPLSGQGITLA